MILYIKSPEKDFSIKKPRARAHTHTHTHTHTPIRNNDAVKLQDTKLIYRNLCLYIKSKELERKFKKQFHLQLQQKQIIG